MKQFSKISVIFIFLAFSACTVDQPVLDDSSQIAVEEEPDKGTPALLANKGVLDDFSGEIYSWWVENYQLAISKKGDTLKVIAKNIVPKYTAFGIGFNFL